MTFRIEEDRMGCIHVKSDELPGQLFYQAESDKQLIYEMLTLGESKDLRSGWPVEIKEDEPRAVLLAECFTLICSE